MNIRKHIREALSDAPLKKVEKDLDSIPIEEEQLQEVSPPGLEHVVLALKKKMKKAGYEDWKERAYKIAWSIHNKR